MRKINKRSIGSLQKGLDILCCFTFEDETLSAQVISKRLSIPLSTIYRYLETLEEKGFLSKDGGKNYQLGYMAFQLGNIIALQRKLVNKALPYLKSLSSISGETIFLSMIAGWRTLVLETVEAPSRLKLTVDPGSTQPLYAGAASKILLAYQKDSFINSFFQKIVMTKVAENTTTDRSLIRKELRIIREQGFAFSCQEVDSGASAIAAPIFNRKGSVIAGLVAAGPKERFSEQTRPQLIKMLKDSAKKISEDLMYPSF